MAEQPSARSSSARALDGPAGDALARWAGYASRDRLLEVVDAANLLPAGERWSVAVARERAANLAPILRDRRVLLLGRRVAAAFGVAPPDRSLVGFEASVDAPLLRECQDARLAPHPSGRCRAWNDEAVRARFRRWWASWVASSSLIDLRSGGQVDHLNPDPRRIAPGDIAHGLHAEPRFGGQTSGPWSVLRHSILVAYLVLVLNPATPYRNALALGALAHDAHEALGLRDLPTPAKRALIGGRYHEAAERVQAACDVVLGDVAALGNVGDQRRAREVLDADHAAMIVEARQFMASPGWRARVAREWRDALPTRALLAPRPSDPAMYLELVARWRSLTSTELEYILFER